MGVNFDFSGGIPAWLAIPAVLAALALTAWFYLRARAPASSRHLAFLTVVRLAAVLVVATIAFKPLVTRRVEKTREGERVILVDTSGSMGVTDYPNLPNRLKSAVAVLSPDSPAMDALKRRFKVTALAFDKDLRGEVALAALAALSPGGNATSVSAALSEAAALLQGRDSSGIILFSDGVETAAEPPPCPAQIPITAVGVGSRLSAQGAFKDLILSSVEVLPAGEPVVSKDNLAQIAVHVEGLGLSGLVTPVLLKDAAGAILAQETLAVDAIRGDQRVALSFTPSQKGNFKYTVEIPARPEETLRQNNSRNLNITVTDAEIRVLYVEGTLRWEYRHLKSVLERDPNVRLLALVRLSERMFYQQGNVSDMQLTGFPADLDTLKRFNVIILGDLAAASLAPSDMANIREAVYSGAGLVMLGGYSSFADGGWAGTAVAEVLPVTVDSASAGQDKNAFVPALTDLGETSPIFAGITDWFAGPSRTPSRELPALLGQVRLGRPKPGAAVLATNPLRSDADGPLAVLVTQSFGSGRAAAFAGDTTWQWYTTLRGLGLESPHVRFWGQMVRWLARRDTMDESGRPGVTAWVDKAFYALGDEVAVTAEVRGADGLLTDKAAVEATLEGGDAFAAPMGAVAGAKGRYACTVRPSSAGPLRMVVRGAQDGASLGKASAAFEVGVEDVELRRIDLDEDYLRRIASASGGEYLPLGDFPSWVASLESASAAETTVEVLNLRQKRVLYPLYLIFIALVTAEWIWRKRLEMT